MNFREEQVCAVWDIPECRKPVTRSMKRHLVPLMDRITRKAYPKARLMWIVREKR